MTHEALRLAPLLEVYPNAKVVEDGPRSFVFLPSLQLTVGGREYDVDALLSPDDGSGYETRLYLSEQIVERPTIGAQPANWTTHVIGARTWYTWSWRGVPKGLPLVEMLFAHVSALR